MARVLYFDCFSGISGDMVLGAFIDAGLPLEDLKYALGSLAVSGYDVTADRVLRAGLSATKFTLHEHHAPRTTHHHEHDDHPHDHPHRTLAEIFGLIDTSALSSSGRQRARALF